MTEEGKGLIDSLLRDGKEIIFRPQQFFQGMPLFGGYVQPLLFALSVFAIILVYNIALLATGLPYPGETKRGTLTDFLPRVPVLFILWISGLFLGSVILHGAFKLLKGKGNYQATFRLFAFCSIANLLTVVPLVGQYLSTVYAFLLIMMGGKGVHGLSNPRAIAAPLLPALFLWFILVGLALTGVLPLEKLKAALRP